MTEFSTTDYVPNLADNEEADCHFLLRLPTQIADRVRRALISEDIPYRMTIQINDDCRHSVVRFDKSIMQSKIVDLPTIIEILKTDDSANFYKSGNICQMMVCQLPEGQKVNEIKSIEENPNEKNLWPHGVSPPLKNVRKKRFRKILKRQSLEGPEIIEEVKRLLRLDSDAIKVSYEIEIEDIPEEKSLVLNEGNKEESHNDDASSNENQSDRNMNDEEYLFGSEFSSSDDETSEIDGTDSNYNSSNLHQSSPELFETEENNEVSEVDTGLIEQMKKDYIISRVAQCKQELSSLEFQYDNKVRQVISLGNPTLRTRMECSLENHRAQMLELQNQIRDYESAL